MTGFGTAFCARENVPLIDTRIALNPPRGVSRDGKVHQYPISPLAATPHSASLLELFRASRFVDVSLAEWMALTPPEVVAAHLRSTGPCLSIFYSRQNSASSSAVTRSTWPWKRVRYIVISASWPTSDELHSAS